MLAITHYSRLLHVLRADGSTSWPRARSSAPAVRSWRVELEDRGYVGIVGPELAGEIDEGQPVDIRPAIDDPFGGPGLL